MPANVLGAFFFPVSILLLLAYIGLPLFCVIDAAGRSSEDFRKADSNKVPWIVLPLLFNIVAAIIYLAVIRPKVKAAAQ